MSAARDDIHIRPLTYHHRLTGPANELMGKVCGRV